jgi:hypothetical protein
MARKEKTMGLKDTNFDELVKDMIEEEIIDNDELTLNEQIDYIDNKLDSTKIEIKEIIDSFRSEATTLKNDVVKSVNEAKITQEQIRKTKDELNSVKNYINSIAASEKNTIKSKERAEEVLTTVLELEHEIKQLEKNVVSKFNEKEIEFINNTKRIEENIILVAQEHNKKLTKNISKARKTNIVTLVSIAATVIIGGVFIFSLIEKFNSSELKVAAIQDQTKTLDEIYKKTNFDNYVLKDEQISKEQLFANEVSKALVSIKKDTLQAEQKHKKELEELKLAFFKQLENMPKNSSSTYKEVELTPAQKIVGVTNSRGYKVDQKVGATSGNYRVDQKVGATSGNYRVDQKVVPTSTKEIYYCYDNDFNMCLAYMKEQNKRFFTNHSKNIYNENMSKIGRL